MIIEGEPGGDRSRGRKRAPRPQWRAYEQEVAELVAGLDAGTTVEHDRRMTGRISGVPRQLDALVQGQLAGQPVSIAVEAKRYGRKVSIGTVDEFVGKILDVGCDRGVLYAAGGFSDGALSRASNARNPAVGCVHLAPTTLIGRVPLRRIEGFPNAPTMLEIHLEGIIGKHTEEYDEWVEALGELPLYRHRD